METISKNSAVVDLGRMDYQAAWDLQAALQKEQIAGERGPVILFVEHPPTITVGRRGTAAEVVAPDVVLKARGVAVVETDRGGQVTYHGPGQLVAYPLVNVERLGLHEYMRLMEEAVIRTIARWGIEGYRVEGRTGVWVGKEKICAMGIRVRKWWAMHGLALNVTTDLHHFGLIIPCGIRDRGVCSMEKLLGNKTPSMDDVKAALSKELVGLLAIKTP
ncbi:lipoyl(octanoyl) transferase LipB [soil metagenome]